MKKSRIGNENTTYIILMQYYHGKMRERWVDPGAALGERQAEDDLELTGMGRKRSAGDSKAV